MLHLTQCMAKSATAARLRGIPLHIASIEYWAARNRRLRRDLARRNQFRSSIDAIRQTHRAIEAYDYNDNSQTEAQRLLAIYGLLQALIVQQDALCHLAEALGIRPVRLNRHKRLEEIRNIRNWTVGHPTKVDRYETASHHVIKRPQLGRGGFCLYSAFDDGREQYSYVPLAQLARLQRRVISQLLRDMLAQMEALEQQPRQRHGRHTHPVVTAPGVARKNAHRGHGKDQDAVVRPERRGKRTRSQPQAVELFATAKPRSRRHRETPNRGTGVPPVRVKPAAHAKGPGLKLTPLPGERLARRPAA